MISICGDFLTFFEGFCLELEKDQQDMRTDSSTNRQSRVQPVNFNLEYRGLFTNNVSEGLNNTMGRSYEFVKNPDVVTLGCSFTAGSGLPFGWAWPEIVKVSTGLKVNNCSATGHGLAYLYNSSLEMMARWGKPKKIWAFLPDPFRLLTIGKLSCEHEYGYEGYNWNSVLNSYVYRDQKYKLESSNAHWACGIDSRLYEKTSKYELPAEVGLTTFFFSLRNLHHFCQITETELLVSSWTGETLTFLSNVDFPNTIYPRPKSQANLGDEDYISQWFGLEGQYKCTHKPTSEAQADLWSLADDMAHPGLHGQIHIAEQFSQVAVTQEHIELLQC